METKAEFGAQQFAAGYANGCADRKELIAALVDAHAEIIDLLEEQIGREVRAGDKPPRLIKMESILAKARAQ
jgi:hypothetical protein